LPRGGPRAARLPAARWRSTPGGLGPGGARHRADRRQPSERRRRAGRRPRRRDQRLPPPPPGRLARRALAAPHRQRLAVDRGAPAARVRQRHRPSPADPALHVVRDVGGGGRPTLRAAHVARRAPRPRRRSCVMLVLLELFGGMALLLYGFSLSGEAFQRAFGGRLGSLFHELSHNRFLTVSLYT